MTGFVMFLHGIIAILLMTVILMQSGRGGGLTESFASAESMFGAQTNEFMIKATTVFAGLFLLTCLGLAVLSAQKGKSLMSGAAPISTGPIEGMPPAEEAQKTAQEIPSQVEEPKPASEAVTVETGDLIPMDAPAKTVPADQ